VTDDPGPASEPLPRSAVPPDRYGRPKSRRSRRTTAPVVVVGALALVAAAAWGGLTYSRRTVGTMVSYETSDTGVQITVSVQRDPKRTTECALRARNRAGEEVGRRILVIPPGEGREVRLSERLETRERPITGEIQSCHSVARP
jgi:hypothetical protein